MIDTKSHIILCALSISILLVTGCEKTIIIPQPAYTPRATIQCSLEPGTVPILFLYRTIPYFEQTGMSLRDLFIKEALVQITSQDTVDNLFIDSTYNYIKCEYEYCYKGSIITQENQKYKLEIIRDTSIYTASTTTNLPAVTIDSVGYTTQFKDIYGEHEGIMPYFHDIPNQSNYFRYEMTLQIDSTMDYQGSKLHTPCIGSSSITVVELGRSVYNDQSSSGEQMKLVIEPAYSHQQGLTSMIRIETIDKATYDFFLQLDRQKLELTNPFVEPVFLTNGQFGINALGFFGSITRSAPVTFVFPE